jgi:hypothetical protein
MEISGVLGSPQRLWVRATLAFAVLCSVYQVLPVEAQSCGSTGLAVQVLGSGGPELQDKRASTSYLIWDHGSARVIVDAGRRERSSFWRERSADVAGGCCLCATFSASRMEHGAT